MPRSKSSKHSILARCHGPNLQNTAFWHGATEQTIKAWSFGTVPRGKSLKHNLLARCHEVNPQSTAFWHGAAEQTLGSEKKNRFVFDEFERFLMFNVLQAGFPLAPELFIQQLSC
jgi:hypothetical protein